MRFSLNIRYQRVNIRASIKYFLEEGNKQTEKTDLILEHIFVITKCILRWNNFVIDGVYVNIHSSSRYF